MGEYLYMQSQEEESSCVTCVEYTCEWWGRRTHVSWFPINMFMHSTSAKGKLWSAMLNMVYEDNLENRQLSLKAQDLETSHTNLPLTPPPVRNNEREESEISDNCSDCLALLILPGRKTSTIQWTPSYYLWLGIIMSFISAIFSLMGKSTGWTKLLRLNNHL